MKMSRDTFAMLCGEFLIPIGLALENERIIEALKQGPTEEDIRTILNEEF